MIKNLDKTRIMLYYSKAYRFVGIIGMIFPLVIGLLAMIQDSSLSILLIIPIILFILGLYTYLYSTNWNLMFIKGAPIFEITNLFGRKHIYKFSDCLYFNWKDEKLILKHSQKIIIIYSIVTNYELFIAELQKNRIKEERLIG